MKFKVKKVVVILLGLVTLVIITPITVSYLRWQTGEGIYEGTFTYEYEVRNFHPDLSFQNWHLEIEPNLLQAITEEFAAHRDEIGEGVAQCRLKVRGKLSPRGEYGHLGMARRKLTVSEVLAFEFLKKSK